LVAVKPPESVETTWVATFVPELITLIATPGTAALLSSVTRPEMAPRSVCARATVGIARSAVTATADTCLAIIMVDSPRFHELSGCEAHPTTAARHASARLKGAGLACQGISLF
jgi:hypothetical protein